MSKELPCKPCGYRILLEPVLKDNKTKGGLIIPDEAADAANRATVVAKVVSVGDSCYVDFDRFPNGAWCSEGDFVMIAKFAGFRFFMNGTEYRLINDDEVMGTVNDPDSISISAHQ